MNPRAYGHAMFALLGLGTVDLAALNLWAIPALDESTTEVSSATDAPARAAVPSPAPAAPAAPLTPQPQAAPAERAPAAAIQPPVESQTLLFSRGAWWISPAKRQALRTAVEQLGPAAIVEVDGHADYTGPNDINQRISERRAAAVVDLLTRAGVDPSRIRKRAYGESRPSGTGHDRRVEILIRGSP